MAAEGGDQSTSSAAIVDTAMLIKAIILNSDEGLLYMFRNLVDGDRNATLLRKSGINDISIYIIELRSSIGYEGFVHIGRGK